MPSTTGVADAATRSLPIRMRAPIVTRLYLAHQDT
jgi:hypothetical protein